MRLKQLSLVAIALLVTSATLTAQPPQLRFQVHGQYHLTSSLGLAGWAVAPNLLAPGPNKGLVVAGVLLHGKGRWVEVMGGELAGTDGSRHGLFNIRSSIAPDGGKMDFYAEGLYDFTTKKWTLQPKLAVALPISPLRLGTEIDAVLFSGRVVSVDGGPRLVLPFKFINGKMSNVALAYHRAFVGGGQSFFRGYVVIGL